MPGLAHFFFKVQKVNILALLADTLLKLLSFAIIVAQK